MDGVLKPGLGEKEVVVHIGQLLLQSDKGLVDGQGLPEVVGQHQNGLPGPVGVGEAQGGDGIQGVKEEMGVDLGLESPQLGLLAQLHLVLLLQQLDAQAAVHSVHHRAENHQPQGVHHDFGDKDGLFQGHRFREGPGHGQDDDALNQLRRHRQSHQGQVPRSLQPGKPAIVHRPQHPEGEGAQPAGQGGKAAGIVEKPVQAAEGSGGHPGERPTYQPGGQGADGPGVDDGPLEAKPRVGAGDGQQAEQQPQQQLVGDGAVLPLHNGPQGPQLGEDSSGHQEQAGVGQQIDQQIVLNHGEHLPACFSLHTCINVV